MTFELKEVIIIFSGGIAWGTVVAIVYNLRSLVSKHSEVLDTITKKIVRIETKLGINETEQEE